LYLILTLLPLILLIFWLVRVRFTNAYRKIEIRKGVRERLHRSSRKSSGWGGDAKPARMGHAKAFFGIKARAPAEGAFRGLCRHLK
jgi:hypothetical protein